MKNWQKAKKLTLMLKRALKNRLARYMVFVIPFYAGA